mmetsp:Transcript_13235/g.28322  ORF Transcript_13235/g.28322 Transcript_13235/m.28322 type:complete len:684 (+) Transcript_13235:89-2140(+)
MPLFPLFKTSRATGTKDKPAGYLLVPASVCSACDDIRHENSGQFCRQPSSVSAYNALGTAEPVARLAIYTGNNRMVVRGANASSDIPRAEKPQENIKDIDDHRAAHVRELVINDDSVHDDHDLCVFLEENSTHAPQYNSFGSHKYTCSITACNTAGNTSMQAFVQSCQSTSTTPGRLRRSQKVEVHSGAGIKIGSTEARIFFPWDETQEEHCGLSPLYMPDATDINNSTEQSATTNMQAQYDQMLQQQQMQHLVQLQQLAMRQMEQQANLERASNNAYGSLLYHDNQTHADRPAMYEHTPSTMSPRLSRDTGVSGYAAYLLERTTTNQTWGTSCTPTSPSSPYGSGNPAAVGPDARLLRTSGASTGFQYAATGPHFRQESPLGPAAGHRMSHEWSHSLTCTDASLPPAENPGMVFSTGGIERVSLEMRQAPLRTRASISSVGSTNFLGRMSWEVRPSLDGRMSWEVPASGARSSGCSMNLNQVAADPQHGLCSSASGPGSTVAWQSRGGSIDGSAAGSNDAGAGGVFTWISSRRRAQAITDPLAAKIQEHSPGGVAYMTPIGNAEIEDTARRVPSRSPSGLCLDGQFLRVSTDGCSVKEEEVHATHATTPAQPLTEQQLQQHQKDVVAAAAAAAALVNWQHEQQHQKQQRQARRQQLQEQLGARTQGYQVRHGAGFFAEEPDA